VVDFDDESARAPQFATPVLTQVEGQSLGLEVDEVRVDGEAVPFHVSIRDDTGTITTFAIINIPFAGQKIKPPYVAAYILLDGADIPFLHLVTEIDAADVRMGMRVQAVWKPSEERDFGIDTIDFFRPTGEPDAEYDTYKHHL
jgi:hypothetical protein